MELPILQKLKDGERFDFVTLADNVEQTEEYLHWWWVEKAKEGVISRPEILSDEESILTETVHKTSVDLACYPDFFDKTLSEAIQSGRLPARDGCQRDHFHDLLLRIVAGSSVKLPGRPQLVFAGGGYGSGKTTVLNHLAREGMLPVQQAHHVGVDVFKPLIPEFNLIKAVGDGRASLTVQKECQALAVELFDGLTEVGRSFIWDSSMSNKDETLARIERAKAQGYELTMIAVLTPQDVAVRQAMHRAKLSRRFPHPIALPNSHAGFRASLNGYIPLFDEVTVFANFGDRSENENCYVVAEKTAGANELAILDEEMFTRALFVPKAE